MSSDIQLEDLSQKRGYKETSETLKHGRINVDADREQSIAVWAYATTVLWVHVHLTVLIFKFSFRLLLSAIPMMFFPSFLLYAAETSDERRATLTPLESFLCMNSGILLVTFSFSLLFNVSLFLLVSYGPVLMIAHSRFPPHQTQCISQAKPKGTSTHYWCR